jgi:hypothetical protein
MTDWQNKLERSWLCGFYFSHLAFLIIGVTLSVEIVGNAFTLAIFLLVETSIEIK